jgi:cytochrome c553
LWAANETLHRGQTAPGHFFIKQTIMQTMDFASRAAVAALLICTQAPLHAETFADRVAPCLSCHGEKGQSTKPEVPSLGGQTAPYVLIQLYLFREKQRSVEIMNEATESFTNDDLRTFSDYIATLPPPQPPPDAGDEQRRQTARVLIQRNHCNACHTLDLSGRDNVPRIADQREDYLIKTLREYKNNARYGYDGTMAEVLAPVTDQEILDLAYYIARFR